MSGEASESNQGQRLTEPPDGGATPLTSIDAFVSYASSDASIANSVVHALEKQGLRCWIAPRDVVPGALYADGIARAINGAKVFVLVLSEHAIASPHVGKEIERASSKRLLIIALHTDSAPLTPAFEYFLSESQWIDARPGSIETAAARLVEGIRRHLNASAASGSPSITAKTLTSRETAIPRPRWLVAGGVAVVLLALLAYFVVDHFRTSKHADIATVSQKDKVAPGVDAEKTNTSAYALHAASITILASSDLSTEGNQVSFSYGIENKSTCPRQRAKSIFAHLLVSV
jgi:hypothetical protein